MIEILVAAGFGFLVGREMKNQEEKEESYTAITLSAGIALLESVERQLKEVKNQTLDIEDVVVQLQEEQAELEDTLYEFQGAHYKDEEDSSFLIDLYTILNEVVLLIEDQQISLPDSIRLIEYMLENSEDLDWDIVQEEIEEISNISPEEFPFEEAETEDE